MDKNSSTYTNSSIEKDIIYSEAVKAGKRIYYLDVRKTKKDEFYLSITESKKIAPDGDGNQQVTFEKHKIFLYREDFEKFSTSLKEAIDFVVAEQGEYQPRNYESHEEPATTETTEESDLKIDIDF